MQLTIKSGPGAGTTVKIEGPEFTIGREAGVDLVLADGKASRRHAALRVLPDGRATLYDLGSSNGTFVNRRRIPSTLLQGRRGDPDRRHRASRRRRRARAGGGAGAGSTAARAGAADPSDRTADTGYAAAPAAARRRLHPPPPATP